MLLHIGNRKGTKDGRGYPALSTRDFVVNNASHGGEPEGRRVGKVYGLVGPSPSHSLPFPPSLPAHLPSVSSRASFLLLSSLSHPIPISFSAEPVAHKLIRSRCLLARDSHWPPYSHAARFVCFVARLSSPFPSLQDQDNPFSPGSPETPNIH